MGQSESTAHSHEPVAAVLPEVAELPEVEELPPPAPSITAMPPQEAIQKRLEASEMPSDAMRYFMVERNDGAKRSALLHLIMGTAIQANMFAWRCGGCLHTEGAEAASAPATQQCWVAMLIEPSSQ